MSSSPAPSMLDVFNDHFARASQYVDAPEDLLESIRICHHMYSIQFPVRIKTRCGFFRPTELSTPIIACRPKAAFAMPRAWISTKSQPWPLS